MVVSVLTYSVGYQTTKLVLIGITATSFVIEFCWIQVVYDRFPALRVGEERKRNFRRRPSQRFADEPHEDEPLLAVSATSPCTIGEESSNLFLKELSSWRDFVALPIFWSEQRTFAEGGAEGSIAGWVSALARHTQDGSGSHHD